MSAIVMPTEEECVRLPCTSCGERPRRAGKRATWCNPCTAEWQREYRAGKRRERLVIPDPVRTETGCLLWQGCQAKTGYGWRSWEGRKVYAHRVAWEMVNGPIPEGMTVDHVCEVKLCVEPDHLELCTRGENVRRYYRRRRAFA